MGPLAANLQRLMARDGLILADVVRLTGLDERTINNLLHHRGARPHAKTIHRLAQGLNVSVDELFQTPGTLAHRLFDRQSNPAVDQIVAQHPDLFDGWTQDDFDELYSHFGTGGPLTPEGVLEVTHGMNLKRDVHEKVALLLESGEADTLVGLIDVLYKKIIVRPE